MINIITTIHHSMESSHIEVDGNSALQTTAESHKSQNTGMRMRLNRI